MTIRAIRAKVLNGGRVTGIPPHMVGLSESPDCENIDPSDYRGASTRPGSSQFGTSFTSASGGSSNGLFHWTRNAGSAYLLAAHSGTLYDVGSAGTWASVLSGITANGVVQMAALNNVLVVAAAGLAPQVSSDASVFGALGGTPPTLAKYAVTHKSKMWLAGDSANPQKLNFSASNDPADWTTANNAGSLTVEAGDGDIINGLLSTNEALIVFKRKRVYAVFGDSPFNFYVEKIFSGGLTSEYGYAAGDRVAFFVSDDGFYMVNGKSVAKLSEPKEVQDFNNLTDKTKIAMGVRGNKLFITDYSNSAPYSLVLDYKRGVWSKYTSQPFKPYTASRDSKLYAVTNASTMQVYQLDTGTAGAVSAVWNTPDLDMDDPTSMKTLQSYYAHMAPDTATTTVTVRHFVDGASTGSDTTLTFGTAGSHDIQRLHGQSIQGRFLRLRFTWSGVKTMYGWTVYADVRTSKDIPARSD